MRQKTTIGIPAKIRKDAPPIWAVLSDARDIYDDVELLDLMAGHGITKARATRLLRMIREVIPTTMAVDEKTAIQRAIVQLDRLLVLLEFPLDHQTRIRRQQLIDDAAAIGAFARAAAQNGFLEDSEELRNVQAIAARTAKLLGMAANAGQVRDTIAEIIKQKTRLEFLKNV